MSPGSRLCWCLGLLFVASGAALSSGCAKTDRAAINGTVTLNGTPVEKGSITFRPQPGTASPSAGANITSGKFSIAAEQGLLPGTFRVEITANRLTGEKVTTRFSSQPVQLEEQYIPDKYNTSSELEITIVPNAGRITQDYELID